MRSIVASFAVLSALPVTALAQAELPSVRGTVVDSIHARPLAGATVIATPVAGLKDTAFHGTSSDAQGRFVFGGLREGRYVLSVDHPWIDSTGIGVPPREIDVRGEASTVLAIPSAATLRRVFCPAAERDTSLGVMLGAIRRGRTTVPGASVVFTWSDFDVDRTTLAVRPRQVTATVTADSSGVYRACGLPLARSLLLQAQTGTTEQSGVIEEQIGEAGLLVRDITLDAQPPTPASAASPPRATTDTLTPAAGSAPVPLGRFVLIGRVLSTAGQPIISARIFLLGTELRTASDANGAFRLAGLPGGTQGVEVLALGYSPRRLRVEIGDQMAPITIGLERIAVVLDSLRVIAKRVNTRANPFYREFDERSRHGLGHYLTEDDIERRRPFQTSDLFRIMPGVRLAGFGSEAVLVSERGLVSFRESAATCVVDVFIDGMQMRADDINLLAPGSLHGVEVYSAATVPAKYRVGPCGAVFLWTK